MDHKSKKNAQDQLTGLIALISSYVFLFPTLVLNLLTKIKGVANYFQTLPPSSQKKLSDAGNAVLSFVAAVVGFLKSIYPAVMKWGDKPIDQWSQPHWIIATPISAITLFWLPVHVEYTAASNARLIYTGTLNSYGLDSLAVASTIYKKTKQWPRIIASSYHFRLPIWKHIWQYLGMVSNVPGAMLAITKTGQPILAWPQELDSVEKAISDENYSIVPYSSVGIQDMVRTVAKLPYDPKNSSAVIHIAIPVSYQRQFLVFGAPCDTSTLQGDLKAVEKRAYAIRSSVGDKRFLLTSLGKAAQYLKKNVLQPGGIVDRSVRWAYLVVQQQVVKTLSQGQAHQD